LRLLVADNEKKWVLWFLRSPTGRQQIEQLATGNQLSMRNISQDALRRIELSLPDEKKRDELITSMEAAFARTNRFEAEAARACKLLDRLEAAILSKAFRGELIPQDSKMERL
jgi:type I restriction enzyme S subunit